MKQNILPVHHISFVPFLKRVSLFLNFFIHFSCDMPFLGYFAVSNVDKFCCDGTDKVGSRTLTQEKVSFAVCLLSWGTANNEIFFLAKAKTIWRFLPFGNMIRDVRNFVNFDRNFISIRIRCCCLVSTRLEQERERELQSEARNSQQGIAK